MKPVLIAVMLAVSVPAVAAPYSNIFVFGDSLSDRGNLAETGFLQKLAGLPVTNYPDPPSNHDSFTNGPVAVQVLAQSYGLTADPSVFVTGFKDVNGLFGGLSYVPGTNYAVAGATSAAAPAAGGVPGANLPQQVGAYGQKSGAVADPNALYILFAGGNDVRNAALAGTGASAVSAGVNAEVNALTTLEIAGAKKLLVVNVPDVGNIPEFQKFNPTKAASATTYSQQYNTQLAAGVATATNAGVSVVSFDLYQFANAIQAAALAGQLPINNTTDYCYTQTPLSTATTAACGPNAQNIGQLYFWDAIHPTGYVQNLWGQGFAQALAGQPLTLPVPAPAGAAVAGLLAMLAWRRRA